MAIGFKFPIRYKILAVLSAVVIAAVALYLYMAARLFYEDKTELIYELNQNTVRVLASDVKARLQRVIDKLDLIAVLAGTSSGASGSSEKTQGDAVFTQALAHEDELVRVVVLVKHASDPAPVAVLTRIWPEYLTSYRRDARYLDHLRETVPIPFDKVLGAGTWVRNATLSEENSPPLMTVAVPVDTGPGGSGEKAIIYADVRLDQLLEALGSGGIALSSVIDTEGHLLASSDQNLVRSAIEQSRTDSLVQLATSSKVGSEVKRFEEDGRSYLGSFDRVGTGGVLVTSRVETGQAFAAAERLIRKSIIYALLVITLAFLVALFFAHHLTRPIQVMLEATRRIARGEFESRVQVGTRDELAVLASSFNSMTADLRSSHEQIREYSRDLEQKVKDRTLRLEKQNVAIKEAQEALVRTTRLASVGEVAGRAAHEVLNPLTNMTARLEKMQTVSLKPDREDLGLMKEIVEAWRKGAGQGAGPLLRSLSQPSTAHPGKTLLEEDIGNLAAVATDLDRRLAQREQDLSFLLKESGRINKIVNGMRQLTRVSANRRVLEVHALLNEALATMTDVLAKNSIRTETKFCEGQPKILADRDELIQVFSNMMRNSMQAIQEARATGKPVGEPAFIRFETSQPGPGRVAIRVCDNGPGIAPENFGKVFEASFTTKPAEEGTGLGLSISRRFIRALEGEITVERSTPGAETVFLIELPEHNGSGA